jgi:tRNA-specific 2-thiouridylase
VRVVAAMSGGVDSSVAAALLKEEGYEVIGVTMQIYASSADGFGGCGGISAIEDAQRVADKLGIPHYVMDFKDIFSREVIADFCHEYSLGRTPNPCIRCNQHIKFGALLEKAGELGADFVVTGHHARVVKAGTEGRYLLKKGIDQRKDQSYVLYPLTQRQLSRALLPIGNFTKQRVREIAAGLGLSVAVKPESQEICFIPDSDYPQFLKEFIPQAAKPGPIIDKEGTVLGEHRGILFYTVGQRKRLGISAREPLYVTAIDRERNTIIVGGRQEVYSSQLIASRLNWIAGDRLGQPVAVTAKIRYLHQAAEAVVTPLGSDQVHVRFNRPQLAVTPGQAIVFYHGDNVLGGGLIERAVK